MGDISHLCPSEMALLQYPPLFRRIIVFHSDTNGVHTCVLHNDPLYAFVISFMGYSKAFNDIRAFNM